VGLVSQRCCDHPARQATEEVAYVCRCHVCRSPPCRCSPYNSSARERNVANFQARSFSKKGQQATREDRRAGKPSGGLRWQLGKDAGLGMPASQPVWQQLATTLPVSPQCNYNSTRCGVITSGFESLVLQRQPRVKSTPRGSRESRFES